MILILTFTSGYMWNKIKNAPYVAADQSGKVSWIAGGYQNQLGMESQVVGGICKWLGSVSRYRLPLQSPIVVRFTPRHTSNHTTIPYIRTSSRPSSFPSTVACFLSELFNLPALFCYPIHRSLYPARPLRSLRHR
jgi:hypothetical protein